MTLQVREGIAYRTRNGLKVGPMMFDERIPYWPFEAAVDGKRMAFGTRCAWRPDGTFNPSSRNAHDLDLVAEWSDAPALPVTPVLPIRTVTRTEIVTGQYGQVSVIGPAGEVSNKVAVALLRAGVDVYLDTPHHHMDAAALRAAARVFISLAEALEQEP